MSAPQPPRLFETSCTALRLRTMPLDPSLDLPPRSTLKSFRWKVLRTLRAAWRRLPLVLLAFPSATGYAPQSPGPGGPAPSRLPA
jgi:hypothetical protein